MRKLFTFFILLGVLISCQHGIVKKNEGIETTKEDLFFKNEILKSAKQGYWLVVRGYKLTDHIVATATIADYSHAGILDLSRNVVIEADSKGVHETSLDYFVHNSFSITLIEPFGYDASKGEEAVKIAKDKLGKPYDFLGLVGINESEKFYCSELTVYCYPNIRAKQKLPPVVKPVYLLKLGDIKYETPERKKIKE